MFSRLHPLLLTLACAAVAAPARADDKPRGDNYTFLVGCAGYDAKELRPLKYPRDDVTAFAEVLRQSGWRDENIVQMHDGRPRRFQPEAKKIRQELQLLLPVTESYEQLEKCPAGRKLLLVDAGRDDLLSEAGGPSEAALQAAVEDVKRLGGTIERDEKQSGRPVVRVSLYPANEEITDDGLAPLRSFPRLQALDLTNAAVTDAGLKELVHLKGLRTLKVGEAKITDAGLKELQAMKNLQELDLAWAQVTDAGAAELHKALPDVRISRGDYAGLLYVRPGRKGN